MCPVRFVTYVSGRSVNSPANQPGDGKERQGKGYALGQIAPSIGTLAQMKCHHTPKLEAPIVRRPTTHGTMEDSHARNNQNQPHRKTNPPAAGLNHSSARTDGSCHCARDDGSGNRRVSTTLRQVFTKFSEFFICCQFSTRKFASGSPRNDDRQRGGPTACPFSSLLGAHFVFPKSIAAGS
jgi:hypothetical protein